ncbi:hypothetical protein I551_9229 [Mycobacterium ulcerans str. Harvey]|uniref:Secreted protein n=1 Tax=Mycobacterium ulcerans str. Harvey TaxID=1299332 RepID=A0ABP3AU86_MYCUL|nr:hypothetical protein I551_9229 [Mycobacterium ulcerans str. Harvey]
MISRLVSWVDDLWCRAIGPQCRHGLSGERSSWLLFVVGLELPVPTVSVLPVSSVPEVFDAGVLVSAASSSARSFSMCWPRCQTRGPRVGVFADGFVGDRGSGHCPGMRGMLFATWAPPLPMMCWPIRGPFRRQ